MLVKLNLWLTGFQVTSGGKRRLGLGPPTSMRGWCQRRPRGMQLRVN